MTKTTGLIVLLLLAPRLLLAQSAEELVDRARIPGGLVVHVGCGDGHLTARLGSGNQSLVQGLDRDHENVAAAREFFHARGLDGKVSARTFDGKQLPYIDNLVNRIVVSGDLGGLTEQEILRVLAPRGVAIFGNKTIVKPWPEELDEWTHWLHGPGNNAVSRDRQVGIARNLQWIMPPSWGRHHNLVPSMSVAVSAGGRIYYILDEAPIAVRGAADRWTLVCRDAFNGLLLWKKPIEDWGWKKWSDIEFGGTLRFKRPDQLFRRLVAIDDVLYATLGFAQPLVALHGATGEIVRKYEGTENTTAILYKDGLLILARNTKPGTPDKSIMAVRADSGEVLWERSGYRGISAHGDALKTFSDAYLTVGQKRVFFLDDDRIVALDLATGKDAWNRDRPPMKDGISGHYQFNFKNFCSLVHHDGRLLLGQLYPSSENLNKWQQKEMMLWALDAASGEKLWEHQGMSLAHFTPPDLFVNHGLAWTMRKDVVSLVGLDVATGEVRREYPVKEMLVGHHHRCYRNKATENFYLAGEEGIEYIDFRSGKLDVHHWIRGACAYGILPANGLIYLPTHACGCHSNVKLHGFLALACRDNARPIEPESDNTSRFTRGPGYSAKVDSTAKVDSSVLPGASDWPVYKHDNKRSSATRVALSVKLQEAWSTKLPGEISAPIVVGDRVYVAGRDSHQVHCLDAQTGQVQWQFTADGPIDTPPTYYKDKVFFGCRSGSVHALRATSGELAWRFFAAPNDTQLMAFGRLESPWPMHGSILVQNDVVYCVAGRSMHLDSGLFAYALDVDSGNVLQQTELKADTQGVGELAGATLPDLMVADDTNIYMRDMRLDPDDIRQHGLMKDAADRLRPNDGGLLDTTWFNSSFWKYRQAAAQMVVFDASSVYGAMAQNKLIPKSYGQDIYTAGDGYRVFRVDLNADGNGDGDAKTKRGKKKPALEKAWEIRSRVRAQSMVLAGPTLWLAGAPDRVDRTDPWGAFEDRQGGMLQAHSTETGEQLAQYRLPSTPIFDSLAITSGRLLVTLKDGTVCCFSEVMP